jgi:hypothetical protein
VKLAETKKLSCYGFDGLLVLDPTSVKVSRDDFLSDWFAEIFDLNLGLYDIQADFIHLKTAQKWHVHFKASNHQSQEDDIYSTNTFSYALRVWASTIEEVRTKRKAHTIFRFNWLWYK